MCGSVCVGPGVLMRTSLAPVVICRLEVLKITIEGQSFVLHQIRRIVGMTIAVVKGYTDLETLERTFTPAKINVPRAPGLGLLLDSVFFDV